MAIYKSIELDDRLTGVVRHMGQVEEYRESLQNLQGIWDTLTLLGQLSGLGNDMTSTRAAFSRLTSDLLNQLGNEYLKKCVLKAKACAQVSIDILVRNLYERTADIGFLATDADIRTFVAAADEKAGNIHSAKELAVERETLEKRFAEYVAKYSVYSDVVLFDTAGKIIARLDDSVGMTTSADGLVGEALRTTDAYVETYRQHDFLPGRPTLVYSFRVNDESGTPIGVLSLCFKFENEMQGIFGNLHQPNDWSVLTLLDTSGRVIASSDHFHIPVGATLARINDDYGVVRHAGREYLAVTCSAQGYQGYMGPGWYGHVMLPLEHAFDSDGSTILSRIDQALLQQVITNPSLFGPAVRAIPEQAQAIQGELNRSVWNGNVRLGNTRHAINASFSKVLLWEISKTGARTKDVFASSIANLHETVVSAFINDSSFLAALTMDIMDRNLYERANDCRWWALTSAFREKLAQAELSSDDAAQLHDILAYINGLYTVYSNLILFDARGKVVAVSDSARGVQPGSVLGEEWVRRTLALADPQAYVVSQFATTPLYDERPTYIYAAPVRHPDNGQIVGGVGIVFDGAPQFQAMLRDCLPAGNAGAFALFCEPSGKVVASSGPQFAPGDKVDIPGRFSALRAGTQDAEILQHGNTLYAVGARMSAGYREYKGESDAYRNPLLALVFTPLCAAGELRNIAPPPRLSLQTRRVESEQKLEIATFHIGRTWLGIKASDIVEAVNPGGITDVPGAGQSFAGYLMYGGSPIPVYDIAVMTNAGPHLENCEPQVVVLQKGEGPKFGILVDGLGEIPEIPLERLQALPAMLAGENILGEAMISPESEENPHLLLVLGVDRMASRLGIMLRDTPLEVVALPVKAESQWLSG
ncbi:chemotaxis protein CheW [Azonexus sp. IMCC34839]|uniref:chemotaxis protein CheW n=1 Tax=Azonexus sp. IMCC34839 TaxID=3133695 RepID=UPI00399AB0FF